MPPRPTLRDVARRAGNLHPSTASRALHNDPAISPETRALVLRAAAEIGYHPDPLLDAFNQHRKEVRPHKLEPVIAFVSDFDSRDALGASPVDTATWESVREAAERLHCRAELFFVGSRQLRPERLGQILHTRGIGSVIIGACRDLDFELSLPWELFCSVRIRAHHLAQPSRVVASDQRGAARLAARHLHEAGCRRIGLVCAEPRARLESEFLQAGYLFECAALNLEPITSITAPGSPALDDAGAARWIKTSALDGVIGDAPHLVEFLHREKIPCAALDATGLPDEIAGVIHDHRHVGFQAVEQVVSLSRANQRGAGEAPVISLIPVSWRDGASLRPAAKAAKPRARGR